MVYTLPPHHNSGSRPRQDPRAQAEELRREFSEGEILHLLLFRAKREGWTQELDAIGCWVLKGSLEAAA